MVTIAALAVELRLREPVNDAVDSSQQDRASLIVEHDHHRGLKVK